jgi:TolB-like protein/DNA-binding winged helix-turn-helix (wHTH) protein
MKSLRLTLLGGLRSHDTAGRKIEIAGSKAALLLAYLALRPGEVQCREKLMALLWSDRAEGQARGSLRQAIWALRRALDDIQPNPLIIDNEGLSLDPEAVESDVASLQQLVAEGSTNALYAAVALYRGPLLEGVRIDDSAFQDFIRNEQERIYDLVLDAYTRLLGDRPGKDADGSRAETAKRLLEIDPLQEVAHRALIRHYAQKGQIALALRQYQTCAEILRRELQVEPAPETAALVEQIRQARPCAAATDDGLHPAAGRTSGVEERAAASPEKPSIAVLPFLNLSGDPEQEFFSDGITEDIITALSRLRWFLVIARHSSFVYKGQNVDVKQIGRELGVRYVLEGSVRKSGNRLRITTELVDAASGVHHWAEHYDRELTDIFELQDDITQKVTATIEPKLVAVEGTRAQSRSPEDLGAWELATRAMTHYGRMTTEDSETAIDLLRQAVAKYPDYGPAHSLLAFAYLVSGHVGWIPETWIPESHDYHYAAELAHRAARLDDEDPWAHLALGYLAFTERKTEEAVREYMRALDLNPNFATAYGYLGWALVFDGQSEEAVRYFQRALRMSPHDPLKAFF